MTREIKRVTLIGLGAMGAYFAPALQARLGDEGFRVLASGSRKERLERDGVTINGVPYRFTLISPEKKDDFADLVIIAVKYTGLEKAVEGIRGDERRRCLVQCGCGRDSFWRSEKRYAIPACFTGQGIVRPLRNPLCH